MPRLGSRVRVSFSAHINKILCVVTRVLHRMPRWRNGRRARFRCVCRVSFSALSDVLKMTYAQVAELVDAHVSGACVERHAGSSPVLGTMLEVCGNSSVGRA